MSLFPIFVKMAGRPALVVGGGTLAAPKIDALLAAGAAVTVVAPRLSARLAECHQHGTLAWMAREFRMEDVQGRAIVFAATGVRDVDRAVFEACAITGVWCNAIDDPEYCDFYAPAIVRRGDLQIAISTNGQSPALAQQIRQELEARFDPSWNARVANLGNRRREVLATTPAGRERTSTLHAQAKAELQTSRGSLLGRATAALQKWLNTEDGPVPLI